MFDRKIVFLIPISIIIALFVLAFFKLETFNYSNDSHELANHVYQQIMSDEIFSSIDQHQKLISENIKQSISQAIAKGQDPDLIIHQLKQNRSSLIMDIAIFSDNISIVKFLGNLVKQMQHTLNISGDACYQLVFPEQYGKYSSDIHEFSKLKQDEHMISLQIIRNANLLENKLDQKRASILLEQAYELLANRYADKALLLADPTQQGIDKKQACGMIIALYQHIISLPTEQAGLLARFMFQK